MFADDSWVYYVGELLADGVRRPFIQRLSRATGTQSSQLYLGADIKLLAGGDFARGKFLLIGIDDDDAAVRILVDAATGESTKVKLDGPNAIVFGRLLHR